MKHLKTPSVLLLFLTFFSFFVASGQEKWEVMEIDFTGPDVANPFTEVQLSAAFKYKNEIFYVDGFYDGNRSYKIRFMPHQKGEWTYTTKSNIPELHNITESFLCTPTTAENHGPVQVRDTFHFAYADGKPFYPLGTTAYAWIHQNDSLIEQTLSTLKQNAFNKIRMTVMPKFYGRYISNEPTLYPYAGSLKDGWNKTRFNVAFFQHLDRQIEALKSLDIEADLILFHPYDKEEWGFSKNSIEENILYLKYIVARLGAYRNIWWSMANEYDVMGKTEKEWNTYFRLILASDPYRHLMSIHNGKSWYNHLQPWITHLSVQTPYLEDIQDWREKYRKPVINDEFVYEGNVPFDWGNLTAEETVNRFWTIYCRGGYASHGETYVHPKNVLWWSKGGKLHGQSPARLAFLLQIMEEAPENNLIPVHTEWNKETYLFQGNNYYLFYYGNSQQASALLRLPEEHKYTLEVIDAWNMTIETVEGVYSGTTEIPLPQKPYMAVRAIKVISK